MAKDNPNVQITRDARGRIRRLDHALEPVAVAKKPETQKPEVNAARYVKKFFGVKRVRAKGISAGLRSKRMKAGRGESEAYLQSVKKIRNLSVVEFLQYHDGIKVWRSGATVLVDSGSGKVTEGTNTFDYEVPTTDFRASKLDRRGARLSEKKLAKVLALDRNKRRLKTIEKDMERDLPLRRSVRAAEPKLRITRRDQVLYPYDPDQRKHHLETDEKGDRNLVERALDLYLPAVHSSVKPGSYRVATEVFFTTAIGDLTLNWQALIDSATDSVLYIRALVEMATGYVYDRDPLTTTGDASITPGSSTAVLNGPRNPRPLAAVAPPNLTGQYVQIQEICPIPAPPPTSATGKFDYNADTDDFSAVNAYYHCDAVFRMVEEMGFDMASYFDGTPFPVGVDHRGSFACVNAAAWSNGAGLDFFTYGLVEAGQPVGIATDIRVVLHEFGHAILFDNVHTGSFGFAHSCGDSLAAVLCDPGSKAPDRFLTFPWVTAIDRRHDRDIAAGWAWGGIFDGGSYDSEQILSTSHFRAYRSLGGDHPELCEQEWAARYLAYLMIHAVGTLTPTTNPGAPEPWSDRLQLCDKLTDVFEGHAGGAVHKVIRWAFEQQGAYQPPGAPTPVTTVGAPPAVDVYINDGRNGEYPFAREWCHSKDIWNRCCPDGRPAHQRPIPGIDNYAYVIVRNRGTRKIKGGKVRAFHRREDGCCECGCDCTELTWPDDFKPMVTEALFFGPMGAGDYAVVGPFKWRPKRGDCILMVADANGDRSNLAFIDKRQTLLTRRLVPFDNNIAMRCICKQCNPDYSKLDGPCRKPHEPPQ